MTRVALVGGSYTAKSLIAGAQRCVNLYVEESQSGSDEPSPATHYPAPGLVLKGVAPNGRSWRGLYRASTGDLYGVAGPVLYLIASNFTMQIIGTISDLPSIVSMADNELCLVLVDGSSSGYAVLLDGSNTFSTITDPAFYGADRVEYVDTFFVFNRPGTNQFYISPSEWIPGITFDTLDIAAKMGASDKLASLIVMRREIWLLGAQKSAEIWFNSGAADFTFQEMPGVFIEHGLAALYSVAKYDVAVFWLSQDQAGQAIVVRGANYQAERISTHAIESAIGQYPAISDAIGYVYQQEGHAFYMLTFPSADVTWCYDEATKQWHERRWIDANGVEHRHRSQVAAFAHGLNLVGDWQNGNLYAFDLNTYTDNGGPIVYRRSFPHMMNDSNRQIYPSFTADMEVGNSSGTLIGSGPMVYLRWSDTRGKTWGNPVGQTLGSSGEYFTSIQWNRLGMARDRVFELFWSAPVKTALNGAFVEAIACRT